MRILFASSEVVPFAKTGGLADVAGALPLALEEEGQEIIIAMPKYKAINSSKFKIEKLKEGVSYSVIGRNIRVYFIEHDGYFNREGLYGDRNGDYKDNLDRFSYYCRRTLELLREINFSRPTVTMAGGIPPAINSLAGKPDIIHLHDWQASLIPVYLKSVFAKDPFYKDIKTLLTIHNIGYQGVFLKEEYAKLGLDWSLFNIEGLEYYDKINLLKGGIEFSDVINTVSPTYSREIQTREFGFGLEGVLNKRKSSLFGILNGLDYKVWDPQTDKFILKNFSASNVQDKRKNKEALQKACGLPVKKGAPLLGIVSRLAEQKGFDILSEAIEKICRMGPQLVILGVGERKYHLLLEKAAHKYPKIISLNLKFDDRLAHKIYAGSDIFLMPSKYEPCGLGQMIALRYGTLPLVFKTGGLADTVNKDNGFVFEKYTKDDLVNAVKEALKAFENKKEWAQLVSRAMGYNFSWEAAAEKYLDLYAKAKSK